MSQRPVRLAARNALPKTPAAAGRRIGSRPSHPGEAGLPVDLGRTLNAALLRRARTGPSDHPLTLAVEDIHLQLRSRQSSRLVVLVVDTSDSMGEGPESRMAAAFGAILSLAAKAYLNRDRVCLVAFRDRAGQLVIPPTNSIQRIRQQLTRLPVGGATPFTAGLELARQVIRLARIKDPGETPLLVLISDGEATVPLQAGGNPAGEVLDLATRMQREDIPALVIDTHSTRQRHGLMPQLAEILHAEYHHIHDLRAGQVLQLIERSCQRE